MPFGGLLALGGLSLAGSIFGGITGSNAAKTASGQQVDAENKALDFQKQIWGQEQQNIAPWLSAGSTSIADLMKALQGGQFGAGSNPNAPQFNGTFTAPTLAEAQNSPGYEFTRQQGTKGVLQGAAAAGGAISGGTLKALDTFGSGLADTTYNNVFNRSLATYGAGLQGYQAKLAGYGADLAKQNQEFGQMFAPAQLGEQAATGINAQGNQTAQNVGNLMAGIGNAQAAGTVGSANALTGAVTGGANNLLQTLLLSRFLGTPAATGPRTSAAPGEGPIWTPNAEGNYPGGPG